MTVNWQKLIVNTTIWAISEISLNLIGLDTLADYSEFLVNRNQTIDTFPTTRVQ